jgi:hypothetical protein
MSTADNDRTAEDLVVQCPQQPPVLSPAAARTLLALLLAVAESDSHPEPDDRLTA